MNKRAADLARRLADSAEAVCRHYLSNGRREGQTWRVGDGDNTPGRSLSVRLEASDRHAGAAGKWIDFATGEHGDLLDLIARSRRLDAFRDVLDEARQFLRLPPPQWVARATQASPIPIGSPEKARRLFASARPIRGTIAETYLRNRGIRGVRHLDALRFHPKCSYRPHAQARPESWPALLAAVTDLKGTITGVLRTWLKPDGSGKAPFATPRRAMGRLLGNGARFGAATEVMTAGEGIETMLSLRAILPSMPMVAALSTSHLAALLLPPSVRRLYVARDNDAAGYRAAAKLSARSKANGIEAIPLAPLGDDFNSDLLAFGREAVAASLRDRLAPMDVRLFVDSDHHGG